MKEAEALLRKGLGLVHNMADGVSRQEQELGLLICLGQALFATQGWAAPDVSEAYDRARKLCQQLDQPQKLLPILYGQWINHAMHGEMDRALQLASEIRQLGGDRGDRILDLMGRWSGGFTSLHLGDFADARVNFEDGIKLFDPVQRHQYLQLTPIDALVFLSTQLSLAQACLGFLDRAALAVISEPPKRVDSGMPTHWLPRCTSVSERVGPGASIRQFCCRKLRSCWHYPLSTGLLIGRRRLSDFGDGAWPPRANPHKVYRC